jgi:hypothetical protein
MLEMFLVRHMAVSRGRSTARRWIISVVLAALAAFPASFVAQAQNDTPALKKIVVRDGVELHYDLEHGADAAPLHCISVQVAKRC